MIQHLTFGQKPYVLLITAGLHGDETGCIPALAAELQQRNDLPPTLFIPEMSPSAVVQGTRRNESGNDFNRSFTDRRDPEVNAVKTFLHTHGPFKVSATFHEDIDDNKAYIYDIGKPFYSLQLEPWLKATKDIGIEVLNGVDDPDDSVLGRVFTDGYYYQATGTHVEMFEDWIVEEKLCDRSLTIETPGRATPTQKQHYIRACLDYLLIPAASSSD